MPDTLVPEAVPEEKVKVSSPMRLTCTVEGHEDEVVFYKRDGWTFKHFRLWESAPTDSLVGLVMERVSSWTITNEEGKAIKFQPNIIQDTDDDAEPVPNPEAFDKLDPAMAAFLVGSFRMAYLQAGMPDPN